MKFFLGVDFQLPVEQVNHTAGHLSLTGQVSVKAGKEVQPYNLFHGVDYYLCDDKDTLKNDIFDTSGNFFIFFANQKIMIIFASFIL